MERRKNAWAQAAVDAEDIDEGIRIAKMAMDEGADWIEIGTPLIYKYGEGVIGTFRRSLGKEAVLVADYKFVFPFGCMDHAEEEGADYAIFEGGYQTNLVQMCLEKARGMHLKPIFYLSVHPQEYAYYADLFSGMGAQYFFSHRTYTVPDRETHLPVCCDNAAAFNSCRNSFCYGITNDNFEEAADAIRTGADWIVFGKDIRTGDRAACRRWLEMIHSTPRPQ